MTPHFNHVNPFTPWLHFGWAPIYSFKEQMSIEEITGGSPYGASTIVGGMGERMPSSNELKLAKDLGRHLNHDCQKVIMTELVDISCL